MKRVLISQIHKDAESFSGQTVTVAGWARSIRASNEFGFADLNDGSCFTGLQVVLENSKLANKKTALRCLETASNYIFEKNWEAAKSQA